MHHRLQRGSGLLIGAALVLGMAGAALAEGTVAVPQPITPDPALCQIAPRTIENLETLFPKGDAYQEPVRSASVEVPVGLSADAGTVEGVTATVQEIIACFNGGEYARALALFTDEALLANFGWLGWALYDPDSRGYMFGEPQAMPADEQQTLVALSDVARLADGSVGAMLVIVDPASDANGPETMHVSFTLDGPRWRVDGLTEFSWGADD